jgi:hypothetical protein
MIVAPTTVSPISDYDVSPDDQRFRMLKLIERAGTAPGKINAVLNWSEELIQNVLPGLK